jgi:beta-glucuronidase
VISVNQYEAWYSSRTPDQIAQVTFETPYEKPLIFSEFGADALYGHRGPKEDRWTEEYQAWLFAETLKLVERTAGCVGFAPWLLKDFRSPRRWHGRFQANWNRKGVINEEGRQKLAFDVLRAYYRRKDGG